MSDALHVSDVATLNALTRALVAAKFQLDPVDRDVPGSTILSELANRVADLCGQLIVQEGRRTAEQVAAWRAPAQHDHVLTCVRARIQECEAWGSWAPEEKVQCVETLLAPYLPEPTIVQSLCEYGDTHHADA